jgi:hypothetical protein
MPRLKILTNVGLIQVRDQIQQHQHWYQSQLQTVRQRLLDNSELDLHQLCG